MALAQTIAATNGVMAALVAGLEREFGRGAGEALAHRFLAAEESDLLWDMRVEERWLGRWEALEQAHGEEEIDLDRVAITGRCNGAWFVAVMLVDGEGEAHGVIGRRSFRKGAKAHRALALAH
ncbi:hypothetical protein KFK14_19325 [Sphingobium phenoxybenzoativorans]|uniref:Uncharacterized protein n=1 Tax=Sphingobium phenoxybenzoativorans TaxID=1592790 RepID=A0A975Q177_9SPHN|nr:hypothetical protein [Sphingobium phenoxybenzoativorans]QUT05128.1 hypothetical protein KFK14_19325 [Sphingobium phenoxybenzoativorans]